MPKPANKPIIAVDIDDVLAASAEGFIEYSNQKWGTNLSVKDYSEHWAQMWQIDYGEEEKRRQSIIKDKLFLSFRFDDHAKPVVESLTNKYKLVITTSRSSDLSVDTRAWIKLEFGDLFEDLYFAKIWDRNDMHATEKLKLTKADLLLQIGASYLIDDQPKHCFAAAEAGIKTILFGEYSWNKLSELPPRVNRAKDWPEVLEYFANE